MSVTEQMVIHAQEFNTRIDQVEQHVIQNHQELMAVLVDLMDRIAVLEVKVDERH